MSIIYLLSHGEQQPGTSVVLPRGVKLHFFTNDGAGLPFVNIQFMLTNDSYIPLSTAVGASIPDLVTVNNYLWTPFKPKELDLLASSYRNGGGTVEGLRDGFGEGLIGAPISLCGNPECPRDGSLHDPIVCGGVLGMITGNALAEDEEREIFMITCRLDMQNPQPSTGMISYMHNVDTTGVPYDEYQFWTPEQRMDRALESPMVIPDNEYYRSWQGMAIAFSVKSDAEKVDYYATLGDEAKRWMRSDREFAAWEEKKRLDLALAQGGQKEVVQAALRDASPDAFMLAMANSADVYRAYLPPEVQPSGDEASYAEMLAGWNLVSIVEEWRNIPPDVRKRLSTLDCIQRKLQCIVFADSFLSSRPSQMVMYRMLATNASRETINQLSGEEELIEALPDLWGVLKALYENLMITGELEKRPPEKGLPLPPSGDPLGDPALGENPDIWVRANIFRRRSFDDQVMGWPVLAEGERSALLSRYPYYAVMSTVKEILDCWQANGGEGGIDVAKATIRHYFLPRANSKEFKLIIRCCHANRRSLPPAMITFLEGETGAHSNLRRNRT